MDKKSKKVLKYLCKHRNYKDYAFFFTNGLREKTANKLKISVDDLNECIKFLNEKGYITYHRTDSRIYGFILKHKGIHAEEFERIEKMRFIYKSILVPIIVSIITTLTTTIIVNGLEHLLPLIPELLKVYFP